MKRNILRFGLIVLVNMLLAAPVFSQARVQVIHNSADEAAKVVDVWLNDILLIDNFEFRTASPFIDAPAGVDFDVTIQPANSTDTTNGLARFTYNLEGGSKYVLVANGIVVPTGYNPATPFDIYVYAMGREMATSMTNTDVLVFHGSTDAPTVDVVEVEAGAGTIIDDLEYAEFAGYLELPTGDYSLQIRDETGTVTVAQFAAPLETLGLYGQSLVVVASGFLDPMMNNNGPAFGLWAALPTGGALVELPNTTTVGVEDLNKGISGVKVYPNPARETINIQYENTGNANAVAEIRSITGALVRTQALGSDQAFGSRALYVGDLPSGFYTLTVKTENSVNAIKFSKIN